MKNTLRKLSIAALIASQMMATPVLCSIPNRDRQIDFNGGFDFSHGIDVTKVERYESLKVIKTDDIAKVIPTDMSASNNDVDVARQIFDKGLTSLFSSQEFRKSDLGKTTTQVERKMQANIVVGGKNPSSTKHVFKFQMKALQTQAQLGYTGVLNANLSYNVSERKTDLELFQDVAKDTSIVYNHIQLPEDRRDVVSLRISF